MAPKYKHLLAPVKVGNVVLKNRLISGNSLPHFLQGPETFPAEPLINHVVKMAKNGAAVVTFADWTKADQRTSFNEDGKRFPLFALDSDPSVENYICQMVDQVHYYNSRISLAIMPFTAPDPHFDVNDEEATEVTAVRGDVIKNKEAQKGQARFGTKDYVMGPRASKSGGVACKALSHEQIAEIIELYANRMKRYQDLGFDMCTLHFAYRATLFSRFISPMTNHRTDEYGGPIENRARFLLELCAKIKEKCGKDFPIEVQLTPSEVGGTTIEETIKLAKLAEGLVDIFQFRAFTGNLNHPTGFNFKEHEYYVLEDCAKVKASGTKILCEVMGGVLDAEDMEKILSEGKADLIGSGRAFIRDFDFYQKVLEGRGNDTFPCILCNKCHVPSLNGEWLSLCSVNPRMGIEHRLHKLAQPTGNKKKVAVVGGGPAGMRAALYCNEFGHDVTLYEATDRLGGQLKVMDAPTFKWPLVRYRNWCISQLEAKPEIKVVMNTRATPELLEQGGYDVVVLALGALPKMPPIPGAEKAWNILSVFGNEDKLGKKCVVVGGSESGTEAGLYLAENGHSVTILTRSNTLAADATPIHYRETIDEYYQKMEDISYVEFATTTEIGDGWVEYRDENGETHRIECDSVVALGGMGSLSDEAMTMYGIAAETYMIGDCYEVGNLHKCNRGAFSVASNL